MADAQRADLDSVHGTCLAEPVRTWSPLERADREDEKRTLAEINKPRSLGTFADLLDAAKAKKK